MQSLWNQNEADQFSADPLDLRVYTSRLLGREPALVLHGGGNTSVKMSAKDFYGDEVEICAVKGSGWDLATIERAGFAPVRLDALLRLAEFETLSDPDMVRQQRAAMLDPDAPNPSIEAILHAILPFRCVDHTHANAVVALTNLPDGAERVRSVYGDRMIVIPYVMPGFILARTVLEAIRGRDLRAEGVQGLILMNHGIFTFDDDPRRSYELMIEHVTLAEEALAAMAPGHQPARSERAADGPDLTGLASLRQGVSRLAGRAQVMLLDDSPEAIGYSNLDGVADFGCRGPLTPDHVIRTKRIPLFVPDLDAEPLAGSVAAYADAYRTYFERHAGEHHRMLDPAPRFALVKGRGTVSFGNTAKDAAVVADLVHHTLRTVQLGEAAGGWHPVSEPDLFEIEYWDLEQAKLRKSGSSPVHQGKVAIVTGSAAGIGFACAESLAKQGANIVGFDLNPGIVEAMASIGARGVVINLTDSEGVRQAVADVVRRFGGLDMIVSNAGIFTAGAYLEDMDPDNWGKSMAVNLTSHQVLLKHTIPFLKLGVDPAIVLVGSRNVAAPGAGAASYSCAKAGLTQLCRVAALELAPHGVRCNIIHPDAVFDTKLWTPEALQRSAERYGITVEEYKTRNLMKTEIKSRDVGDMVAAMLSPLFGKTTGAQLPVDGGNDRVI